MGAAAGAGTRPLPRIMSRPASPATYAARCALDPSEQLSLGDKTPLLMMHNANANIPAVLSLPTRLDDYGSGSPSGTYGSHYDRL